ncbi:cytidylate kinase [Melghirimyces profundicolus]|uniref:Cytidylate kinase n=1 Tax=Melghirimyces profundicolus TaxID=1242148 RepID=A0A2T6BV06_9BACL|nr:(d)CMP kinase [Melghirimyces profundicolus]PTX59882.1 cytidylate kinase [Melghirimyces profundicolus]
MSRLSIAIDGPAGAGKSTVARQVAGRLGLTYVDTGAMYRAITWKALKEQVDLRDEQTVSRLARETEIRLTPGKDGMEVWVDGERVTRAIRTPEVTSHVSLIAGQQRVREVLVDKQREMASRGGVVMDGRDIGTHVLPDADVKVFLTASIEERAKRRYRELVRRGYKVDWEELKEEIRIRDEKDRNREHSPLRPAEDAVHLDTTGLSIEEVIRAILDLSRSKVGGVE